MGKFGDIVGGIEDDVQYQVSHMERYGQEINNTYDRFVEGAEDFFKSWEYDTRPAVEGQAKAIHPNMFMQFTGLRFVGVTRVPSTAAGIGKAVYDNRKVIKGGVAKAITWTKKVKDMSTSDLGKLKKPSKPENPFPKTTKALKKNPRVAGTATGVIAGTVIANSLDNATNGRSKRQTENEEIFIYSKKKVSRRRWVT